MTTFGGRALLEFIAGEYPRKSVTDCPAGDAIVVLSGTGPIRDFSLRKHAQPNRLESGLTLYEAGLAPRIVITVATADRGHEAETGRAELVHFGVPADRISELGPATDTEDEVRLIVAFAKGRNWHTLILVTSGYHMGRATLLFQEERKSAEFELKIVPFPADPEIYEEKPNRRDDLIPSARGREYFSRGAREVVGQTMLKLRLLMAVSSRN